jgi:signal transducing adaptor molecule
VSCILDPPHRFRADYYSEGPSDNETRSNETKELKRILKMSLPRRGRQTSWEGYPGPSSGADAPDSSATPDQASFAGPSNASASRNGTYTPWGQSFSYPVPPPPPALRYGLTRSPSPSPASFAVAPAQAPASHVSTEKAPLEQQIRSLESHESTLKLAQSQASCVRALYTFEADEPEELSFVMGDIIKVLDRVYNDWWKGQLGDRTGIFPSNYVVGCRHHLFCTKSLILIQCGRRKIINPSGANPRVHGR